MNTPNVAPYRIATDSRPNWKIRARTHGPIRPKTLTVPFQIGGTLPHPNLPDLEELHRRTAQKLAERIAPGATVEVHSTNGHGNAYDWRVILP